MRERPSRLYRRFVDATLSGVVGVVVAAGVPVVFKSFRDEVAAYPRIELIGATVLLLVAMTADMMGTIPFSKARTRPRVPRLPDLFPYIAAVVLFASLTFVESTRTGPPSAAAIYLSIALLVILAIVRLRLRVGALDPTSLVGSQHIGFAATSVLVLLDSKGEHFLLLLNKNLNSGRGLWVPPGGHFQVGVDPAEFLISKIRSEVGMSANVWISPLLGDQVPDRLTTIQTRWLTPPIFILDEDLLGLCSHGHARHLDLVYVCETAGGMANAPAKYGPRELIYVPVADCAASIEAAERAVHVAIQEWHKHQFGAGTGVLDTVTRDVPQRLHLVARLRTKDSAHSLGVRSSSP